MSMLRQLRSVQCMGRFTAPFTQDKTIPHMERNAALEVGKGKVDPPVASIGGAQQREKRLVLINRQ